ncbi:MAG: ADP-dependent glucokinase/phosphofructokinase [Candidatus Jordarchaeales archaeon]
MKKKDWMEAYSRSLEAVTRIGEKLEFIIGFNVNIDAVRHVDKSVIEKLASSVSLSKVLGKISDPPLRVESLEDFLAGLLVCIRDGIGEEWIITNERVSAELERLLGWDERRMGGQGGNMSNVLARLGHRVVVNAPSLPKQQAELFHSENIAIPVPTSGGIVFKHPREAVRPGDTPLIHWISEFKKGFSVKLGDLFIEAPRDNRFIASFDDVNTRLLLAPGFREGSVMKAEDAAAAIVSGYHLLRETYPTGETCESVIKQVRELISEWKKVNPELLIHAEMGFTSSCRVRKAILDAVFPRVDSVGFNEVELRMFNSPDHTTFPASYSAPELYLEAKSVLEKHNLKRVFVHTREYSMSILKQEYGVNLEEELASLLFGALIAATLASTGTPTLSSAREILRSKELTVCEDGIREHEKLALLLDSEGECGYESFLELGFAEGDPGVVFIPSLISKRVKATVGLGDAICSATLAGESLLRRSSKLRSH